MAAHRPAAGPDGRDRAAATGAARAPPAQDAARHARRRAGSIDKALVAAGLRDSWARPAIQRRTDDEIRALVRARHAAGKSMTLEAVRREDVFLYQLVWRRLGPWRRVAPQIVRGAKRKG